MDFELTRISLHEIDLSRRAPFRFRLILPSDETDEAGSTGDTQLRRSIDELGVSDPPILVRLDELLDKGLPTIKGKGGVSNNEAHLSNEGGELSAFFGALPSNAGDGWFDLFGTQLRPIETGVKVQRKSHKKIRRMLLVSGFRRVAAASALGIKNIESLIMRRFEGIEEVVTIWLEASLWGAPLSEVEKALLILKATILFGSEWKKHLDRLSSYYGRRLSTEYIDKLKRIFSMDEDIVLACHRGVIRVEELLKLDAHPNIDAGLLTRFLEKVRATTRERSEIIRLVTILAGRDPDELQRFLSEYPDGRGSMGRNPVEAITQILYPALTKDTERIERIVSKMGLPTFVSLSPPQNLEGAAFTLRAKLKSEEDLAIIIKKLNMALKRGELKKLLDILKGK